MPSSYQLVIKTTAACQLKCPCCDVLAWRESARGYQTPLEDIERLIYYSRRSGYVFELIRLTGGDPFLWKHLVPAVKMLAESGITTDLRLVTNGLAIRPGNMKWVPDVVKHIDHFEISQLKQANNLGNIQLFRRAFPGRSLHLFKSQDHIVPPYLGGTPVPVPGSLPATCMCSRFSLAHGRVDICTKAREVLLEQGKDPADYPYISEELGDHFLSRFLSMDRFRQDVCRYCSGNRKVQVTCLRESEL